MATTKQPSGANRGAVVVAIVGALVGGWVLYDVARVNAENAPWTVGFIVGVGAGGAGALFWWQSWRADRARAADSQRRRAQGDFAYDRSRESSFRPDRSWVAPIVIVLGFAAFGFVGGVQTRDYYLRLYCEYGSSSEAQLAGCMSHVNSDEVDALDTQAARFARGETSECLEDSGPFCASAARWNSYEPARPNE